MRRPSLAGRLSYQVIGRVEIPYLIEKKRLPFAGVDKLRQALGTPDCVIDEVLLRIRAFNIQTVW